MKKIKDNTCKDDMHWPWVLFCAWESTQIPAVWSESHVFICCALPPMGTVHELSSGIENELWRCGVWRPIIWDVPLWNTLQDVHWLVVLLQRFTLTRTDSSYSVGFQKVFHYSTSLSFRDWGYLAVVLYIVIIQTDFTCDACRKRSWCLVISWHIICKSFKAYNIVLL